jgi:hypothetical protein
MRLSSSDVTLIMDGCTTDANTIDAFINSAELLMNRVFGTGETLSELELTEIERFLVAHMISSTVYKSTSREKLGDAEMEYTGKWDTGLKSTPYGQMVLLLDSTGKLANLGVAAATIYAVKGPDRTPTNYFDNYTWE